MTVSSSSCFDVLPAGWGHIYLAAGHSASFHFFGVFIVLFETKSSYGVRISFRLTATQLPQPRVGTSTP